MTLRLATLVAIAAVAGAATVDVEGRWTGKIESPDGTSAPVFLSFTQMGQHVTGTLNFAKQFLAARFYADLQADGLTFQVHDPAGKVLTFHLKVSDAGISGDATAGEIVSKVMFPKADWQPPFQREGRVDAPILIRKADPEYTPEARQAGLQGTVVLYVVVDETGKIGTAKVIRGLGMGLDEKAVECVRKWKFMLPRTLEGRPIPSEATVEVNFRL